MANKTIHELGVFDSTRPINSKDSFIIYGEAQQATEQQEAIAEVGTKKASIEDAIHTVIDSNMITNIGQIATINSSVVTLDNIVNGYEDEESIHHPGLDEIIRGEEYQNNVLDRLDTLEGNLDEYNNISWLIGKNTTTGDYKLALQGDGNFVLYQNGSALWSLDNLRSVQTRLAEVRNDYQKVLIPASLDIANGTATGSSLIYSATNWKVGQLHGTSTNNSNGITVVSGATYIVHFHVYTNFGTNTGKFGMKLGSYSNSDFNMFVTDMVSGARTWNYSCVYKASSNGTVLPYFLNTSGATVSLGGGENSYIVAKRLY